MFIFCYQNVQTTAELCCFLHGKRLSYQALARQYLFAQSQRLHHYTFVLLRLLIAETPQRRIM